MAVFGCGAHFHAEEDAAGIWVEPEEVAKWVDEASCIVVDVRESVEIEEDDPIPGAMQFPSSAIMFSKPDLEKKVAILRESSKPLVFYTNFGVEKSRCGVLCQWLVDDKGFPRERLYRLKDGLRAWAEKKLPTCKMGDEMWKLASDAQLTEKRQLFWEVIGGGDKGSILVRDDHSLKSLEKSERLSTGAVVEQVRLVGERLCYRLVSGKGPPMGWVSTRLKDSELCILHESTSWKSVVGYKVRVCNLQSEAGQKLNNKQGLVEFFDADKQRFVVKLFDSGEGKALKICNLSALA